MTTEKTEPREVLFRDTISDNDIKVAEIPETIKVQIAKYEELEKAEPLDEKALDELDYVIDDAIISWYEEDEVEPTDDKKAEGGKAAEEAPVIPVVEDSTASFPTAVKEKPAAAEKKPEPPKEENSVVDDILGF